MSHSHIHSASCAHTPAQRVAEAEALCKASGARFTDMRRTVYSFLLGLHAPISAYDLLAALQKALKRNLAPPTVYRALDFLLEQGLIHRLETTHAYMVCDHPAEAHESFYLVCSECGKTQEVDDPAIGALLLEKATALGFVPAKPVIEVQGLCAKCR